MHGMGSQIRIWVVPRIDHLSSNSQALLDIVNEVENTVTHGMSSYVLSV